MGLISTLSTQTRQNMRQSIDLKKHVISKFVWGFLAVCWWKPEPWHVMQKCKEKKVSTKGARGQMLCAEICISIFMNECWMLRKDIYVYVLARSKQKNNLMRNYPIHFHLNFWLTADFCPSVIQIFFFVIIFFVVSLRCSSVTFWQWKKIKVNNTCD